MKTRLSQKIATTLLLLSTLTTFHVGQLSTALAQVVTFTNPTPAAGDSFGISVAAVGTDRVLIGAYHDGTGSYYAGAAYLFSTNGALLTTFTNPTPAMDEFGCSLAAVGSDHVLIGANQDNTGATDAGAAYLFSTSGALLTTFTNPTPAYLDCFGYSVAAVGTDRGLIGAFRDNTGATDAGAAYLFSINGALLTTFTNPTPAYGDYFGYSVAAVGTDQVLVGAVGDNTGATGAGAAYLFSTSGALLTTFTNPTPAANDWFGTSVAAVGSDRVLIGADLDDTGAANAGAAYLFSISGALLTTFTNPTPAVDDYFGTSVAAVGSNRVLIGAPYDDAGDVAGNAGAAYLFSTDGALLTTFTNSTPGDGDTLGVSVAAVGSDWVLIGAEWANNGAIATGAAYLFSAAVQMPSAPYLSVWRTSTNTVAVSWPSPSTGWNLQQNTNSVSSVNWNNVTSGIQDDGTNKFLVVNPPTGNRFYRLHKP
jgi:hypothetical protein